MKSFKAGGVHLEYKKGATQNQPIEELPIPSKVILPLQQHAGAPAEPLVKVGDEVFAGQKIGESSKFISASVHASIPGKVTRIEKVSNPCDFDVASVVIEKLSVTSNQLPETRQPSQIACRSLENLVPEEIRNIVREAGVVGMGGAAFPTHVKLTPPPEKKIDTIIINGCECEPYITADHRIMLEKTEDILYGARAIAKAVGAEQIIVGVEDNKKDAIEAIKSKIQSPKHILTPFFRLRRNSFPSPLKMERGAGVRWDLVELKTKYPQGGEKQLIKAILNREVPSGGLPLDIGVIVSNVGTAVAVAEAIKFDQPLIERVVTVTGAGVKEPKNLRVRVGTTFQEAINYCGGLTEDAGKIIMGGPMMGLAQSSLEVPVVKSTTCILVLSKKETKVYEEQNCIRCGRCIRACPIGLMPNFLADFTKAGNWEMVEEYQIADCIECGGCSYVCPSRIYLVQYFKVAKRELQLRRAVCR